MSAKQTGKNHVGAERSLLENAWLLESLDQGVFLFGRDGRCSNTSSKACEKLLGKSPAGLLISDVLQIPADQKTVFTQWCKQLFSEAVEFKTLIPSAPKTVPHAEGLVIGLEFKPMLAADGEILAVVVVATDRTVEIKALAQLMSEVKPSRSVPIETLEAVGNRIKAIENPAARRLYYDYVDEVLAVPVRNVFDAFDSMVQSRALQAKKNVSPIKCIGDEIAVMPESVETLRATLNHLFSNIVDHGIESREVRHKRGKNAAGQIVVEFRRLEDELGPHLRLIVNDDGEGVDIAKLKEMSHVTAHRADFEAFETSVRNLGGSIRVHADQGKGTAFVVELPLDESGHAPRLKSRSKAA